MVVDATTLFIAAIGGAAIGLERTWSGHASGPEARFGPESRQHDHAHLLPVVEAKCIGALELRSQQDGDNARLEGIVRAGHGRALAP